MNAINSSTASLESRVESLKQSEHYQRVQEKLAETKDKGIWVRAKDAKGNADYYLDMAKLSSKTFFTTVRTHEGMIKVPLVVRAIMGQKIDVKDKVEQLMESYMKAVIQSTSHNLIMAKLYGLRMSSLAYVLSLIGVPPEELKKLRKQAIEDAIGENVALCEENAYNLELLEILGGNNGSRMKAERGILEEIQKQILTQASRLGIDDYYTKEKILEMRIKVATDILMKFREEEMNIQYELDYYSE